MTVKEVYAVTGGNYDEAMSRLMTEARITKYLNKFIQSDDYSNMLAALEAKNWEDAFRFSHNLKGMGLNLSLTRLAGSAGDLCEELRGGAPKTDLSDMLAAVRADFAQVVDAVSSLSA